MANDFLTMQEIAQQALLRLRNNLVFANLVYTDYSDEFAQKGDTIQVKKPAVFDAKDFTSTTDAQDIEEDKVLVSLDKIADVTVDITSKQLTLNVQDFGEQVVEGAMQAIAQKIDEDLADLYKDVYNYSGDAGQTPDKLAHISAARKVLNENKVPFGSRRMVVDPEADADLLVLDAIINAEKSGTTAALREASIGRLLGFDTFMNQNIVAHTKGTLATDGTDTIQPKAAISAGATTATLESSGSDDLTGTLVKGDIIEFEDVEGSYVITETATADNNEIAIKFSPGAAEEVATTKDVTIKDSHTGNLAFHRNAFALVNRPMALPMGGADGYVASFEGLTVRATMGYSMSSKENTMSFDILYGTKTLDPRLATRVWGKA